MRDAQRYASIGGRYRLDSSRELEMLELGISVKHTVKIIDLVLGLTPVDIHDEASRSRLTSMGGGDDLPCYLGPAGGLVQ